MDFPLKRRFYTIQDVLNAFTNLKTKTYVELVKTQRGKEFVVTEQSSYDDVDAYLSDWFNEEVRVNSIFGDNISPMEYWEENKVKLIEQAKELNKRNNLGLLFNERELIYKNCLEATNFKVTLACYIYRYFLNTFGRNDVVVLDPCSGWGARMIGALGAGVVNYTGIDPNLELYKGYNEIKETWPELSRNYVNVPKPFEDVEVESESVDLVFTSPPFSDLETYYAGEAQDEQSTSRYQTEAEWYSWFTIFLKKSMNVLKPGRPLVLYLSHELKNFAVKVLGRAEIIDCRRGKKRPVPLCIWYKF